MFTESVDFEIGMPAVRSWLRTTIIRQQALSNREVSLGGSANTAMSQPVKPRQRSVSLTPEGRELLESALLDLWRKDHPQAKLTRSTRSEFIGVSEVTADRILRGDGVDRATLLLAFKRLGLTWNEAYCLRSRQPLDSETDGQLRDKKVKRRIVPLVAVVIFLLGSGLWMFRSDGDKSTEILESVWGKELGKHFELANSLYFSAKFDQAESELAKAVAVARRFSAGSQMASCLRLSGDIAAARGKMDEALSYYQQSLTLRRSFHHTDAYAPMLELIGETETALGRYKDAETHLLASLKGQEQNHERNGWAEVARHLGTLCYATKRYSEADAWFQKALTKIGRDNLPLENDIRARAALLTCDLGHPAEAESALRKCMAFWKSQGHPRWIARTSVQLANVLEREGRHTEAKALATRAASLFAQVGDERGRLEAVNLEQLRKSSLEVGAESRDHRNQQASN